MDTISARSIPMSLLGLSILILIATIGIASCSQRPPVYSQPTHTKKSVESTSESVEMREDTSAYEQYSIGGIQAVRKLPDAELSDFSPAFGVQNATYREGYIIIILCYDIPSSDKDWVLGRLPGDVFLSDGSHEIDLLSFTLVSLDFQPEQRLPRRCDRFEASVPEEFNDTETNLTVRRIAASMPVEVDWDIVAQRVQEVEPKLVFEPMLDQDGPSFALVQTPPDMSNLEAHYLIVGMVDPVILGPWVISVKFDS